MKISFNCLLIIAIGVYFPFFSATAATTSSAPSTSPPTYPQLKSPPPKSAPAPVYKERQLTKPSMPSMTKPFGMPGVVGFQNNRWEGTDYLGYLSPHISIDLELLKSESMTTPIPDASALQSRAEELFTKADLVPHADSGEGPPLPFLHLLLMVYPVDKDRYAIFANGRLFEQIQVMRKNFSPAGYWQGITWENQDVSLTTTEKLNEEIKSVVDKQVNAFIQRYKLYNPNLNQPGSPLPKS